MNVETTSEIQVSTEDLHEAFLGLVAEKGKAMPNEYGLTFIVPEVGKAPEELPYYRLTRVLDPHSGERTYNWAVVSRAEGGILSTESQLSFRDGDVYYERQARRSGFLPMQDQDGSITRGKLSSAEVSEMYEKVTNPNVVRRRDAIANYHHERYAQKSRVGKLVARLLKTDDARYRSWA